MPNYAPQRLVHTTGNVGISSLLQAIPRELRMNILAHAVDRAAQPMVAAVKLNARRSIRTGALFSAIGHKVKKYENDATAVAVVGVRRGYFKGRERVKDISAPGAKAGSESPSHYAHLVEYGHHQATGGTLNAKYNLADIGIGKFSKDGREITRKKRTTVREEAKGKAVRWVQPRPFMRPGFIQSKGQVQRELLAGVAEGIEKVRGRMIRQGAHAA